MPTFWGLALSRAGAVLQLAGLAGRRVGVSDVIRARRRTGAVKLVFNHNDRLGQQAAETTRSPRAMTCRRPLVADESHRFIPGIDLLETTNVEAHRSNLRTTCLA